MEITTIRDWVDEHLEAIMAQFLKGLNKEITNILELQNHVDLEQMVHKATKIKRQLKGRRMTKGFVSVNPLVTQRLVRRDKNNKVEDIKGKQLANNLPYGICCKIEHC